MKIQLINEHAKIPTRGTPYSAGYDLYSTENFVILPGDRHLFKTGLKMEIPIGLYGRIAPRSGLAYKNGIDVLAGVIDSDYRNDVGVILINLSTDPVEIKLGDKIAQIIFETHHEQQFETVSSLTDTVRGTGGFGSTGK